METLTPDAHGIAVLVLTVIALILFTRDNIPLESSSLGILVALILLFQIFPYTSDGERLLGPADFFGAFGNEALVAVCALMIVGKGLETTGALQPLASAIAAAWKARPMIALLLTLVAGAVLSAFLNNTPIVVLLLPILVAASLRSKVPVSGVLMPMGFATILGGMSTTIGTSTNLLVVGIAADLGQARLDMFDFALPVAIVGAAGILFLWLAGPRLVPERVPPLEDTSPRVFSAQLHVDEDSFAAGKTLSEVLARTGGRMRVDRIRRSESLFVAKLPSVKLQPGDRLFVKDTPDNLKEYERELGATLHGMGGKEQTGEGSKGQQLAEVVVTRGSPLHHRTLADSRFAQSSGLLPLALHRARMPASRLTSDIGSVRLRAGDVLLVQGSRKAIETLKASGSMLVLDGTTSLPHTHRAKRALAIMAFVVLTAAFGLLPISVSALAGVGLMLASNCLTWRDTSDALSRPVVLIIVASLGLGGALLQTGMAYYLAHEFVDITDAMPIPFILSAFMLIMTVLTNVVSNNAAAVIGTPIAISIAQQLNADPLPFVLAVLFGANMSYATPIGYQTNLLILSAGGYKFSDFLRVGIPLTLIMWLGFSLVLPLLYGL
ncbi:SLC13 family permease [Lentisalinibacter orientalis]|uniref:SLC13 family permease n=1 Tax=Lentisalinibacter orientalis TaxID=2992241 RepID=UPI0038682C5D